MDDNHFHPEMLERVLSTATTMLIDSGTVGAASILINARPHLNCESNSSNFASWELDLAIPSKAFLNIEDVELLEKDIGAALEFLFKRFPYSEISAKIVVDLEPENDDWRILARQRLSGVGTTNQGRVRSDNIAARQHDGLLFRSRPETLFYDALKEHGDIPFAPLPTVVAGRQFLNGRKRMEPDFVLFKDGIVMVVEIDGDWTHRESPLEAHQRDAVLEDEGVAFDRIATPSTIDEARAAVKKVLLKIEKAKTRRF